jgi:hypothetical protein
MITMKITDFSVRPQQKLSEINGYLKENFGYMLKQDSIDARKLHTILEHIKRKQWDLSCEVKNYQNDPRYVKSVLIAESIKIMIAEIGPVRKNPKATTRRSVNESANRLRVLLEQDLDQAETQLAAKSMVTDLQDMAEDVAKMQVETLMSLVERMKEVFGVEQATQFNSTVEGVLQATLQNLKDAHAQVSNAILTLTGEGEAVGPMGGADMGGPEASMGEPEPGAEGLGGAEAASGPEEEATGREFK